MTEVKISGLGTYLPRHMRKNHELMPLDPPQTLEEIDKVGVFTRGVADEDEGVTEMALGAAERALAEAGVAPESLDFIVLANWTERRFVPDFAPRIQEALGAKRAFAFDVCGACTGFLYGLSIAHGYLQNPRFSRGLVLASDRSSRFVRPHSRGTLIFGDAAAAAVVERGAKSGTTLIDYELRSDGSKNRLMEVGSDGYLRSLVKQREINELAVRSIGNVAGALLDRNGLDFSKIDWIIPHSGTPGIQAMLAEHLALPPAKILTNLPDVGNVTTASIPVALRHFRDAGPLRPGDRVLSASVGLGWQYVAMLFSL